MPVIVITLGIQYVIRKLSACPTTLTKTSFKSRIWKLTTKPTWLVSN